MPTDQDVDDAGRTGPRPSPCFQTELLTAGTKSARCASIVARYGHSPREYSARVRGLEMLYRVEHGEAGVARPLLERGCSRWARCAEMTGYQAVVTSTDSYGLGEGPLWDRMRDRVLWVDVNAGRVHSARLAGDFIAPEQEWLVDATVGAVVCSAAGELLVAGA